ncbi:MAG TPA: hypothetical protein VGL40_12015 [Bacillota bacterium]
MRSSARKPRANMAAILVAALAVTALITAAAGCAKAKPKAEFRPFPGNESQANAPKPPEGTAERPALLSVRVGIGEEVGGSGVHIADAMFYESAKTMVGTGRFILHASFKPAPSADWFKQNVTVEGGSARIITEDNYTQGWAQYIVPKGQEDETITLRIKSATLVGGADSFELVMKRVDEPRAKLEVSEGRRWREVAACDVLGMRPLKLRVTFTQEMEKATVESAFKDLTGKLEWAGGKRLTWTSEAPPAVVRIDVNQARSTNGLWVLGGLPVAYTGEAPRLYAYDPATGAEKDVAAVPTDLMTTYVSPDGQRLLAGAYAASTSRLEPGPVVWRVIDLTTGKATVLPDGGDYVGWAGSGAVVRLVDKRCELIDLNGQKTREWAQPHENFRHPTVSPDGRHLAGLVPDFESGASRDPETSLIPNDLVLIDLENGQAEVVKEFVRIYLPPSEWYVRSGPAWSRDGGQVAAVGDRRGGGEVRVYDLAEKAAHTATVIDGPKYITVEPFSWSPDGNFWVINGRAVGATIEAFPMSAEVDGSQSTWAWSVDGKWVASYGGDGNWGKMGVRKAEGAGGGSSGGGFEAVGTRDGFFCGWDNGGRAYYVKWADVASGYRPEMP